MGLKVITPPSAELLSIDECRRQLGVEPYDIDSDGVGTHPHDAMIMRMQAQARAYVEAFTGLSCAQKTYELALDEFPAAEIELPMPPQVSIESVKYVDSAQVEFTVADTDYVLDDYQKPGWLMPAADVPWPTAGKFANAVKVRYVAGYLGTSPDSDAVGEPLPENLYSAIVIRMAFLYAYREGSPDKSDTANHQACMTAILTPMRTRMVCL